MKISVLAILPHQMRSVSAAMIKPKNGSGRRHDQQPEEIIVDRLAEFAVVEHPDEVVQADKLLARPVMAELSQTDGDHRIDQVNRQCDNSAGPRKSQWPDGIGDTQVTSRRTDPSGPSTERACRGSSSCRRNRAAQPRTPAGHRGRWQISTAAWQLPPQECKAGSTACPPFCVKLPNLREITSQESSHRLRCQSLQNGRQECVQFKGLRLSAFPNPFPCPHSTGRLGERAFQASQICSAAPGLSPGSCCRVSGRCYLIESQAFWTPSATSWADLPPT